jgi:putative transposase
VQGLPIVRPDHVWVGDITYIRLQKEFVYLAVLMDVYTRAVRGWHLSRHLDQALTLTALRRALVQHRPDVHHPDQGVQYAATAYVQTLRALGVQISMATVGEATENGYAERLMRTIKEEKVTLHGYTGFREACQSLPFPQRRLSAQAHSLGLRLPDAGGV